MDNLVVRVVAGLAVGITMIVVMVLVGDSLTRYEPSDLQVIYPAPPGEVHPMEEDVDGCCDNVAVIESTENTGIFIVDESGDELNETLINLGANDSDKV